MNENNNPNEESLQTESQSTVEVSNTPVETISKTPEAQKSDRDKEINKEIAALSYIWILSVPIFFLRKDSKFVQAHATQGIHLFGVSLVAWFIATINYIWWLGVILLFVYIYLIIKGALTAIQGKDYYVPFLSDFLVSKLESSVSQDVEEAPIVESVKIDEDTAEVIKNQEREEETAQEDVSNQVNEVLGSTGNDEPKN